MDIFLTFAGHGLSEASMQVNFVVHAWCVFFGLKSLNHPYYFKSQPFFFGGGPKKTPGWTDGHLTWVRKRKKGPCGPKG